MRNRLFAAILAFVFGSIGLNEYYLGNTATGIIETILSILFCWTFIIPWAIYLVNVFRGTGQIWLAPTLKVYNMLSTGIADIRQMDMNTSKG